MKVKGLKRAINEPITKLDVLSGVIITLVGMYILNSRLPCITGPTKTLIAYDGDMEIVFVGGVPGSGVTLIQGMLDSHPDIRCSTEPGVVQDMVSAVGYWYDAIENIFLMKETKIDRELVQVASRAFITEVLANQGTPALHICSRYAFVLSQGGLMESILPRSRYVLMLRDGRAVAHSIVSRALKSTLFNTSSYRECLERWNVDVEAMYNTCLSLGPWRCMPVYYEQLVLNPEVWMRRILGFLNISWSENVLHHEDFVGKPESSVKVDKYNNKVLAPVNGDSLYTWVGYIPDDDMLNMDTIAPMLSNLGYDPAVYPPKYETMLKV